MRERQIDPELVSGGLQFETIDELHERREELRAVKTCQFFSVEIKHDVKQFTHTFVYIKI
jgi:hypothetical protein